MTECIFCRIIAKEAPAYVLDESDEVIVFLSLSNHPLVVPKLHIADIYGLPSNLGAAVMEKTIDVARAVKTSLQCDGVYLTQANEHAAGQDIFHYHLHVYPCWGDGLRGALGEFLHNAFGPEHVTEAARSVTAEKIREGLGRST